MTTEWEPVRYFVETDTMAIEIRPWPGVPSESGEGEDAGPDLVIHYYPGDGNPWLWEIEHASEHPEYIGAALREMRSGQSKLHTVKEFKLWTPKLLLSFDDDDWLEFHDMVDLSPMLAQGGVFEPLRDPRTFELVTIGPHRRSLVWKVGVDKADIVLSADVLWSMKRSPPLND
jgi:hypothetical protein